MTFLGQVVLFGLQQQQVHYPSSLHCLFVKWCNRDQDNQMVALSHHFKSRGPVPVHLQKTNYFSKKIVHYDVHIFGWLGNLLNLFIKFEVYKI